MAKLDAKWWNSRMPAKFDSVLCYKLKLYTAAVKTSNVANISDALMELRFAIDTERTNLIKKFKKSNPRLKSPLKDLDDMEKLVEREDRSLVKRGASEITVWSKNFCDAVASKQANQKFLKFNGGLIEVKLNLMTVHSIEECGTQARFFRALEDAFDDEASSYADEIREVVEARDGQPLMKLQCLKLQNSLEKRVTKLNKQMVSISNGIADKAAADRKDAKAFKKEKAISITTASLGVIGSAAGVAMPGTLAVALVVLIRSTAKLGEEIVSLALTLEGHYKRVMAEVKMLEKSFNSGKRDGKEVTKISANAIIGADVFTTYSSCVKHHDEFLGTLSVLADRVNTQQLKIIEAIAKLGEIDKALVRQAVDGSAFKRSTLKIKTDMIASQLDKTLDSASDTMNRVVAAERSAPKLRDELMKLGGNSKTVKVAEVVIPACVNLALSIGSFSDGVVASKHAATLTVGAVGLASDISSEIVDLATA